MRTRLLLLSPLSLLLLAGCPDEEEAPNETPPGPTYKAVDIPDTWESDAARIILRITNSSTTTTQTHRALTKLFNEQIDVGNMLMRGGLARNADGDVVPPGTAGQSNPGDHEDMLGGSSVDQARALVERTELDGEGAFPKEMAVDSCGNPMLASFVTPDTLPHILEGDATQSGIWPKEACGPDASCSTLNHGVWDVAFSETRYDGMVDVAIMLQPDATGKITRPGLWGHLVGFFLSENNPGYTRIPLFANIRQASVSIQGLLKNDRMYIDAKGYRETYVYPHSARTLTPSDIIVALIGHEKCEDVWESAFGYQPPFGCELGMALGLDMGAPTGPVLNNNVFRNDPQGIQQVVDVLVHQIGASVACPGVDGAAWVREGPVELFTCPSGNVDLCIGREDAEDFACEYLPLRYQTSGDGAPIPSVLANNGVVGTVSQNSYQLNSGDTFVYVYDGQTRTLTVNTEWGSSTIDQVVTRLNSLAAGQGHITFGAGPEDSNGNRPLVVSRASDVNPAVKLEIGNGTLNSRFGFSAGEHDQIAVISGRDPYELVTATTASAGFIAVDVPVEGRIYTDEPGRILGVYGPFGEPLDLPDDRQNTHCPDNGPAAFDLTDHAGSRIYLKIQAGAPLWLMPSDPESWIP